MKRNSIAKDKRTRPASHKWLGNESIATFQKIISCQEQLLHL